MTLRKSHWKKRYNRLLCFAESSPGADRAAYYTVYTILFLLVAGIAFSAYFLNGKSLIWTGDGLHQHYNSLLYYGKYLRGIISGAASGNLEIPLWDHNIGYGADILTSLHYYVLGDPLTLLSAFVPERYTELLYNALVIVRLYLCGISFSVFCRKTASGRYAALCGTFLYVFCGFALQAGVRHPYFINPMIYFPLLLLGAEKVLRREKPYLFIGTVFLSAVSSFYFFYMLASCTVIYTVIRYFFGSRERGFKDFAIVFGKMLFYAVTGLLMACAIFLPVVLELFTGGRLDTGASFDLFYNPSYYVKLFTGFVTMRSVGKWTWLSYSAVSFLAITAMFLSSKKYKQLKIWFIILSVIILLPVGGYVMHGFSYVSNRWIWAYSFLIAFIVVKLFPRLIRPDRQLVRWVLGLSVFYIAVCFAVPQLRNENTMAVLVCLLGFDILLLLAYGIRLQQSGPMARRAVSAGVLLLVVCNVTVNAIYHYSMNENGYAEQFQDKNKTYPMLMDNGTLAVKESGGLSPLARYEETPNGQQVMYNSSMLTGLAGTSFYYSVANAHVADYLREIRVNNDRSFRYVGLDSRAMAGALAGVEYFVAKEGNERYLPYGYHEQAGTYTTREEKKEVRYTAYRNSYALPFGYTYSNSIPQSRYQALSPLEKQQALMQGVVFNDGTSSLAPADLQLSAQPVPYEMTADESVTVDGNRILVKEEGSSIVFRFTPQAKREIYLQADGLYFSRPDAKERFTEKRWNAMSSLSKGKEHLRDLIGQGPNKAKISVHSAGTHQGFHLLTPINEWYEGRHDYMIHVGYQEEVSEIRMTFHKKGQYEFGSFSVISQPMEGFAQEVSALSQMAMEDVNIGVNRVEGTLSLTETRAVLFAIPYSRGWSLTVNGEDYPLCRANTMFMAAELPAGEYSLMLRYSTPGLKAGLGCTALGVLLFGGMVVTCRLKAKKK